MDLYGEGPLKIDYLMKKLKLYCLFPTTVAHFSDAVSLSQEEKDFIHGQHEVTKSMGGGGNTHTVNNSILERSELANIRKSIMHCVNIYAEEVLHMDEKRSELYLTTSWLNFNDPGTSHHSHTHPNSILSGVLYLTENPEHTRTQKFFLNTHETVLLPVKKYSLINSKSYSIDSSYCGCLLFPSSLSHNVSVNRTNEIRITLAFNVFARGVMGGDHLSQLTI